MKRFAYYIACCTLVALCACTHDDTNDVIPAGNGKIMIQASLDDMAITRAFDGETAKERTVTHIDVFAVDPEGNIDYYERNTAGNNNGANEDGSGVLTLNVARRAKIGDAPVFAEGVAYKFYLVANSRTPVEAIKDSNGLKDGFKTEEGLKKWIFDDIIEIKENVIQTNLHLTGTTLGETNDTDVDNTNRQPQTFLMDAVAKFGSDESVVVNPTTGGESSLTLSAEFKRAAAKILVNIKQGPDVVFHKNLSVKLKDEAGNEAADATTQTAKYYFYKLPASTFVLPNDQQLVNPYLITTASMDAPQEVNTDKPGNEQVFRWSEDIKSDDVVDVQVLGYAYAHEWSDVDLTNETSLILNIPMYYKENDTKNPNRNETTGMAPAPNSWYKVPLSKDKIFKRNTCYVVNITINAVGATNKSDAIQLRNIEYETLPWQAVGIDVGDNENRPAYLELNTDLVEIYNMNFDYTQLEFSSSSYIPNKFANENSSAAEIENIKNNGGIILTDAYYYNYLDQKVDLSTTAGDKYKIYANIKSTAEQDVLNGKINIDSPFVGISEQELYEQFGAAPVVPEMPTEPVNPEPADEAKNPGKQSDYATAMSQTAPKKPKDGDTYYTYRWNDGRFERKTWTYEVNIWGIGEWDEGNWSSKWQGSNQMLTDYNNALAAWETWDAWNSLPQSEKDAAIAKYNEDVATYSERLTYYNQQVAAKEKYDEDVAAYTAGKVDSHSNAIRYLVFEVYNETGQKATFTVAQYPTLYITNEMGYYSYRSDFGGTTYESNGNPNRNWCEWSNGDWSYGYSDSYQGKFFQSKVYDSTNKQIDYYYNKTNFNYGSLNNPRMYHVHVTATSSKYTVGKPRLDSNGYTESSLENSKLVSPSFMIASQLGATTSPDGLVNQAKRHCEQYIEVTKNGKIYDDWRLPTAAEIEIIASHQDASDAMATVMTGWAYYCSYNVIDGEVVYYQTTGKTDNRDMAVRCIRDAY